MKKDAQHLHFLKKEEDRDHQYVESEKRGEAVECVEPFLNTKSESCKQFESYTLPVT